MILQILVIILIIEFIFSLLLFKGDILAPAIVFSFVFLVAGLDLTLMSEFWNVQLQRITLTIITSGIMAFIFGSYVVESFKKRVVLRSRKVKVVTYVENFRTSKRFLDVMIIIYLIVIGASIIYVVRSSGLSSALTNIMASYVMALDGGTELNLPIFLLLPVKFLFLAGFIWSYQFVNNWICNRIVEIRYIILIILTLLLAIANGKRGELIAIIITMVIYMIMALKKNGSKKLSRRVYWTLAALLVAVVFSFQSIATMMGRDSNLFEPMEYFSIYLGAPILNLDTSIKMNSFLHPVPFSETFHSFYSSVGENFGIKSFLYETDRIFWSSPNGKRVGNVATVFYDFYHDGGMIFVIIMSFLMGVFSQSIYKKLKRENSENKMFITIVYAYILWMVMRSFFANSLFDWFTLSTIITLFVWWFYSVTIPKM